MAYEVNLIINGKKEQFKRTEPPFLKEITRALVLQQHQIRMYGKNDGPTDKDFDNNSKEIAKFASQFFKDQFTQEDFLNGADGENVTVISNIIDKCLGVKNPDDIDTDKSKAKK